MATTTITVASFQDACAECADAIGDENTLLATKWYARAEAINSGLDVEGQNAEFRQRRRESLNGLKDALAVITAVLNMAANQSRLITTQTAHG